MSNEERLRPAGKHPAGPTGMVQQHAAHLAKRLSVRASRPLGDNRNSLIAGISSSGPRRKAMPYELKSNLEQPMDLASFAERKPGPRRSNLVRGAQTGALGGRLCCDARKTIQLGSRPSRMAIINDIAMGMLVPAFHPYGIGKMFMVVGEIVVCMHHNVRIVTGPEP
mgnify:CR=1 FL=1